jgi:hypothetical protein
MINRFVMIEGDLSAFAAGVLPGRGFLRFASTIRRAAALLAAEHEVLFTGDTSTPDKRREEKQAKKRTGESSVHHSAYRVPPSTI